MKMRPVIYSIFIIIMILMGCAPYLHQSNPVHTTPATLGYTTAIHSDLLSLPEPREKIVIAVYKFRDQTGQYKASSSGMTWSTAVTQGATSMLLKAMEESGWFIVVEREGISNLLNERKIIRSTRENYTDDQGQQLPPLPPLLYAGVTIEGGIISYETNTLTGGFGARYFGIGGNNEFRSDQVNIYLRSVATKSGRILNQVNTTKTILSQAVDFSVYKFVRESRLLEIESGYSTNEPPQMCVLEAIEKAVLALVCEGIVSKSWELKNPADIKSPVIQRYLDEKQSTTRYTLQNSMLNSRYAKPQYGYDKGLGLTLNVGSHLYQGDYSNPEIRPMGDASILWGLHPNVLLELNGSIGRIANKENFYTDLGYLNLQSRFTFWSNSRFRPFGILGAGAMNFRARDKAGVYIPRKKRFKGWEPVMISGLGVEYFINPSLSMNLSFINQYTFTDYLDGVIHGSYDDYFWGFKLGFSYY